MFHIHKGCYKTSLGILLTKYLSEIKNKKVLTIDLISRIQQFSFCRIWRFKKYAKLIRRRIKKYHSSNHISVFSKLITSYQTIFVLMLWKSVTKIDKIMMCIIDTKPDYNDLFKRDISSDIIILLLLELISILKHL